MGRCVGAHPVGIGGDIGNDKGLAGLGHLLQAGHLDEGKVVDERGLGTAVSPRTHNVHFRAAQQHHIGRVIGHDVGNLVQQPLQQLVKIQGSAEGVAHFAQRFGQTALLILGPFRPLTFGYLLLQ